MVKILVVLTDVTASLERERQDRDQREVLTIFERVLNDRAGFLEFLAESTAIVRRLIDGAGRSLADVEAGCAYVEGDLQLVRAHLGSRGLSRHRRSHGRGGRPSGGGRPLRRGSNAPRFRVEFHSRERSGASRRESATSEWRSIPSEYDAVVSAVAAEAPRAKIQRMLELWKFEPARARLFRVAEQVRAIGKKLNKGDLAIDVEANRDTPPRQDRWAPFWSAFTHLVHAMPWTMD